MSMMRAVVATGAGGPEVLEIRELPRPTPGPTDALIEVIGAGINRAEILQRSGVMPLTGPNAVPGLECAGVVRALGAEAAREGRLRIGDRVGALTASGSYAEFVSVPSGACLRLPASLEDTVASALPEAAAAAWWNLIARGRLRAGESVLIHGAAGGVASLAVPLACSVGARVLATARGATRRAHCLRLGAQAAFDPDDPELAAQIRAAAPGGGVDVILDNVGGPTLRTNVELLASGGRLVVLGVQGGGIGELDLGALMARGAEVSSSSLGRLSSRQRADICARVEDEVIPLVASAEVRPVVAAEYPMTAVRAAHEHFERRDRVGKVVLRMR
ncbi:zinc-binding dehydrogenase [Actinoalloteichus sp. GBA129-24]|uniref:zinc-binding dehydrogenase n=1 Tax=Actinoalloteichus sp. GBA129-24 TaxID=1612551 RepID=UPI0009506176|nr:zinc-binding dehydrogenase [Actinoalloteichus sp. GBA129-24]APU22184.1 putative NAD(P)H quinone oxidoreductase, PIG3 family [Actinoalloteichus sp. GBA129-24]